MPYTRQLAAVLTLLAPALLAQTPAGTPANLPPAQTDIPDSPAHPGIRIVRLSQTEGVVTMSRNFTADPDATTPAPLEPAFTNLPVVQGAQLRTAEGVAEVEFEDNTTLRLAPDTLVRFRTLSRDPSGLTTTVVDLLHGTAFATTAKGRSGNTFAVAFGPRRALLAPGTHIRLQFDDPATRLAVLDGLATVQGPSDTLAVEKKHGLLVDPQNPAVASLTGKDTEPSPFDTWDKQSASFHTSPANLSAYAGTGFGSGLYGLNDMAYYGSFVDFGGSCGSLWQPFFASASWNPYNYGVFAYYPGAGYSFVSPYPWGWTPFHSGSWQQCGNAGWGWRPAGATFTGLRNTALLPTSVHAPLVPPHTGQSGLVVLNTHAPTLSHPTAEGVFVFNRDSAGLGVPRSGFGKLAATSRLALAQGSANISLEPGAAPHGTQSTPHAALAASLHSSTAGPVSAGSHPGPITSTAQPSASAPHSGGGYSAPAATASHGAPSGGHH